MSANVETLSELTLPTERLGALTRIVRGSWGTVVLVVALAVVAAVPGLNLLAFGYLLDVQGALARGTRLRHAFSGFDALPRLGGAVVFTWLWVLPVRLLSDLATDAALIDPSRARGFSTARWIAAALIAFHLAIAWSRGARPGDFLPWRSLRRARPSPPLTVRWPSLKRLATLGLFGLVGSMVWLSIPAGLLALARTGNGNRLFAVLGILSLVPVLVLLPVLQLQLAESGRFGAIVGWRAARTQLAKAPWAFSGALILLYLFTLPLFLLEVVLPPSDARWLVTLVFIVSVLPFRLLLARCQARAHRATEPANAVARWTSRLVLIPLLAVYAGLLYLTPLIASHGSLQLFAPPALTLPIPF